MKFTNKSRNFYIGLAILVALILSTLISCVIGVAGVFAPIGTYEYAGDVLFIRTTTPDDEGYSEDSDTICPVYYVSFDQNYTTLINYTIDEWVALGDNDEEFFRVYHEKDGDGYVVFNLDTDPTDEELKAAVRNKNIENSATLFTAVLALLMISVSCGVVVFFGDKFSLYEKIWFMSILVLSGIVAVIFPEEDINGFSGLLIMALYLADTFLNILCELLISKQSKWNFIVSVFVEIVEIAVCLVLAYRFATMAVTLFFWLPCDIASFINWNKKKDRDEEEITKVRTLKGWQEALLIGGIVVWTIVVGYFLSGLDIATDIFGGNELLANVVCYLDACASAVGIMNGLAILFRFREQWIAWYICAGLETIMNILAGQWVLLVLKVGYLTNTTYGYIRWTKYIKKHPEVLKEKTVF